MDAQQMIHLFGSFFSNEVLPRFQHYRNARDQIVTPKKRDGIGPELAGQIDHELDQLFKRFLSAHFPNDEIFSEERASIWTRQRDMWVVDPCDGTHNFLSGLPTFGSTCTLIKNGKIAFTAIFLPLREMETGNGYCFAVRGRGAGERTSGNKLSQIHVSKETGLNQGFIWFEGSSNKFTVVEHLKAEMWRLRTCSATSWSGVLVASGGSYRVGFDGLITVENKPWDNLPVWLLIEEAGGKVTNHDGTSPSIEQCGNLIMSNGHIHQQIVDAMKNVPIY